MALCFYLLSCRIFVFLLPQPRMCTYQCCQLPRIGPPTTTSCVTAVAGSSSSKSLSYVFYFITERNGINPIVSNNFQIHIINRTKWIGIYTANDTGSLAFFSAFSIILIKLHSSLVISWFLYRCMLIFCCYACSLHRLYVGVVNFGWISSHHVVLLQSLMKEIPSLTCTAFQT